MWGLKRKLTDVDFINYINNFDIILLGETWLNKNDETNYDIKGFLCDHVFASKSLGARKGRYSGGISVYYRTELKDYVSVVEKNEYGLMWLKIGNNIMNLNSDIFIGYLYARDKNSRIYRSEDIDYFELLEADIAKYQNLGKVFVCGDINARTGCEPDYILFDHYIEAGLNINIESTDIPPRKNKDHVIDSYGKRLIELCKTTNLLIANGRLGSDKGIGEFTFYGQNGCSAVDYLLLSLLDFETISHFNVCETTEFSDHAGITFGIFCKKRTQIDQSTPNETPPRKILWNENKAESFKNDVSNLCGLFDSLSQSLEQDSSETNINNNLKKFSDSLYSCSDAHFGTNICAENSSSPIKENRWFDNECRSAKREFNSAKRQFSQNRSEQNRTNFIKCRTKFNKIKRKAKAKFKRNEGLKISKLAKSNPKSFWKKINKFVRKNKSESDSLSAGDFFDHFSEIFGNDENQQHGNINSDFEFQENQILDSIFSENEVKNTIQSLASNKSPGIDGLIPELFKSCACFLTPFLTNLFNTLFTSGVYPKAWTESYITPIHKKGNIDDANNYRGIALTNIIAKIYSKLLHDRLTKWATENEKIIHNQFGFQKNKSTVDCIFILHSLIAKTLNNNEKLFCTFVDYQKAFDSVDRKLLWYKLLRDGCSTTMVNALKAMYNSVQMCVKYKNKFSNFFASHSGVKQGDPLSTILFIFFINDLALSLADDNQQITQISSMNVFLLLFADDAVLFSTSPDGLQLMLDKLQEYSNLWNLRVNTEKTKIMIFERGRSNNFRFYYNEQHLKIVESFKYLGVTFYKNGNWHRTQKCIAEYGTYALHNLYRTLSNIQLSTKEKLKLFDSLVGSVLSYASEVWGYSKADDIERVHTRFCRSLLGVKRSTNLSGLYMELGRIPLAVFRQIRMLTYWSRIIKSQDPLICSVYAMLRHDADQGHTYNNLNWASHIKSFLDQLGFSNVWLDQDDLTCIPLPQIRQRLFDQCNQSIITAANGSQKLILYNQYKTECKLEPYLDLVCENKYKIALSRFRLSSHSQSYD